MVFTTKFTELVAAFRCADAQLREALRSTQQTKAHVRLLRRTAELLDRIEKYLPTSSEELEEIADHYARRRLEGAAIGSRAAARFADALRRSGGQALPSRPYATTEMTPIPDPLPEVIEGEALANLVVRCRGRLSAVGRDGRFIAASAEEADALGMTLGQLLGCRFQEVVGCGEPALNECRALGLALAGQQSTILRDGEVGAASRRVRLAGVMDAAGHLYAAIRHVELLAPDHTSPGTT